MTTGKVFHSGVGADETDAYRSAVARIIADVQAAHDGMTDIEFADAIDVSTRTIANARNKHCDLSPVYLTRIGRVFGGHWLNPYFALLGGHYAPNDPDVDPALIVDIGDLMAWFGRATHPDSPGGPAITHCEFLTGEPIAERVRRHSTGIVERARKIRGS